MSLSCYRFARVTALLVIFTLTTFLQLPHLAQAQEPAPFEIRITPQAKYAVSGQPFTYTVAITNVSRQSLKDILVKVRIPEGSVFAESYFVNPNWFVGGVQRGQAGEIIWLTQAPVAPGEVMTFDLAVNVLAESAGRQLINDEYSVATIDNSQLLASGPPVRTEVLIPTPTPSPPVEPTRTPIHTPVPTATPSPTPLPPASPDLATATSAAVAAFTPASPVGPSAANASIATSPGTTSRTSSIKNIFTIIGISALMLLIGGLVWFWKRR